MTTMDSRYEISGRIVGVIEYAASLDEAERIVANLTESEGVLVFDRLARRGGVDLREWRDGRLVGCRRRASA